MSDQASVADLPVLAVRRGMTVGLAVWSAVLVVIVATTSAHPVVTLLSIGFTASFWGVGMAVGLRRAYRRLFADLVLVDEPSEDRSTRAFREGVLRGAIMAVLLSLFLLAFDHVLVDDQAVSGFLFGFLPGGAVWLALEGRFVTDLQRRRGAVLYSRAGAGQFAWTKKQAQGRVVGVSMRAEGAVDVPQPPSHQRR